MLIDSLLGISVKEENVQNYQQKIWQREFHWVTMGLKYLQPQIVGFDVQEAAADLFIFNFTSRLP